MYTKVLDPMCRFFLTYQYRKVFLSGVYGEKKAEKQAKNTRKERKKEGNP